MRLVNAAKYFDDIKLTDAYTLATLPYKGQFSSFQETDPDGSVSTSRSMSIAPGLALPARGVVNLLGETWLLGEPSQDGIFGASIRQTVPMKRVTDLFSQLTPGQAVSSATGTTIYGRKDHLLDNRDTVTSSGYFPFYELFFSYKEALPVTGTFFRTPSGTLFRCRSAYEAATRILCAQCDLVDKAGLTTADFGSTVYDPITDTYATGAASRTVLAMYPHQLYVKTTEADPAFRAGDLTILVRMVDGDVQVGQQLTLQTAGLDWVDPRWWEGGVLAQILSVTPEADAWNLHIRRA